MIKFEPLQHLVDSVKWGEEGPWSRGGPEFRGEAVRTYTQQGGS